MKITNTTDISILPNESPEKKGAAETAPENNAVSSSDRVELSVNRANIERLTGALNSMENMNAEKIESIKNRIADGSYTVSGEAVAEKMLRSLGILTAQGDET